MEEPSDISTDWVPGTRLFPWPSPLVHENCSFDLIPDHTYDEVSDIKAYLAVLGARQPLNPDIQPEYLAIPWFWRPPHDCSSLTDDEQSQTTACEDSVRRGVEQLQKWRTEGRGVFVDEHAPACDLWYPYAWIPASTFGVVKLGHYDLFRISCVSEWSKEEDECLDITEDMVRGNVRLPLIGEKMSGVAALSPEDPLWPVYIAHLYQSSAHATALALIVDCSCYEELKENEVYKEAVQGEIETMRQNAFTHVPSLEELKTTDVV